MNEHRKKTLPDFQLNKLARLYEETFLKNEERIYDRFSIFLKEWNSAFEKQQRLFDAQK